MLNSVDKELIKKRFRKNLSTYDQNATLQKQMTDILLSHLIEHKSNNFNKCMEIGCGSGFLTEKILEKLVFEELFANDIVENSLNQTRIFSNKLKNLYGDCENIIFPSDLDLVISNATFQWIQDFPSLCNKIYSSLNSNGAFVFSTFGKENLYQIKTITGKSLNYYEKSEVENILSKNFKILYSHSETLNLEFDSAQDILNHLKLCGVNSLEIVKWTKNDLKNFGDKYNKLFKNNESKLILTYNPMYFICAKINF